MKKLIINADDFALHHSVNKGIITASEEGVLTSTSIIPSGAFFDEAVKMAILNKKIGIGVHLTLVHERPILPIARVKSLITTKNLFHNNYLEFIKKMLNNEINYQEVYAELSAQIKAVQKNGITITHLDSHQHLHILPKITDIVLQLAQEYNIKSIRIPDEALFFTGGYPWTVNRMIGRTGLSILAKMARLKIGKKLFMPDHFFGMLAGGNMKEEYLLQIIKTLPAGITEIMMHPAESNFEMKKHYYWDYCWQDELKALLSERIKKEIKAQKIELISFGDLVNE